MYVIILLLPATYTTAAVLYVCVILTWRDGRADKLCRQDRTGRQSRPPLVPPPPLAGAAATARPTRTAQPRRRLLIRPADYQFCDGVSHCSARRNQLFVCFYVFVNVCVIVRARATDSSQVLDVKSVFFLLFFLYFIRFSFSSMPSSTIVYTLYIIHDLSVH